MNVRKNGLSKNSISFWGYNYSEVTIILNNYGFLKGGGLPAISSKLFPKSPSIVLIFL
ncbi:MAG: hypothetical protein L6Q54_04155 [Leptospiraceae bacterium]|nr:hypothetical protein [Leptospiraceae bacterium]